MPKGKPAGVRCVQLTSDLRCALFGRPERPAVCSHLKPSPAMCGESSGQAMRYLAALEAATDPGREQHGSADFGRAGPGSPASTLENR